MAENLKPRKLSAKQIEGYTILGHQMAGFSGGIFPNVKGGQEWPGLKGQGARFVMDANNYGVVFIQDSTVFYQPAQGWVEDYRTYHMIRGAQGAQSMATISIFTIDVLMGIASAYGGVVRLVIVGVSVLQFLQKHMNDFPKWIRVFKAIANVRAVLMTLAPTLYDKVIDVVLRKALSVSYTIFVEASPFFVKLALPNLAKAVDQNVHKSGRALGKLIGNLGVSAMQGKLKLLGAVVKILLFIVTRVLVSVPKSISIQVGEYKKLAADLIKTLRGGGAIISEQEVQKIFEEIRKNPKKIQELLNELKDSLTAAGVPA